MDLWLDLVKVKKGQVHLKLEWLGFTENPVDLKESLVDAQNNGLASCMLTVTLDSAKNLPVRFTYFIGSYYFLDFVLN